VITAPTAVPAPVRTGNWKEEKKKLERELRLCEKRLADCEKEMQAKQAESDELNKQICEAAIPPMKIIHAFSAIGQRMQILEADWLEISEERERLQKSVDQMK
jgi:septal ring factor EnvC (AmiA/AmiB activator)